MATVPTTAPSCPCWLPCASGREHGESRGAPAAPTSFVFQVADALAECLSNPDVGSGSHGATVVAAGPAQLGERDRRRRRGCGPVRRELIIENAVLRHQVNVLRRRSKRPKLNLVDRLKLLIGARFLSSWRRAIVLVQPETVVRWHRAGFRRFWRRRSRLRKTSPLPSETIDLIRDMAARGRLWGAERVRGELLKLGIKVSKRTIQKYMRGVRGRRGGGQSWATFVKNHAERMWVCDFIQTHDLLFRQVYAFFLVHLASRRVVHVTATRCPTQAWTAQQLRNATMDGDAPAVLLRDRDDKFGPAFDRAARGSARR